MYGLSKFGLSRFGMARWLYEAQKTGAEGGGSSDDKTDDGAGGDPEKAGEDKSKEKKEVTFDEAQQEYVNKLVGEARVKEREKAQAAAKAEAEKEKKKSEQEALKAQEKWKELAEQRETENAELVRERDEALAFRDKAEKFEKALNAQLAGIKKTLPKHIVPLIDKMDPVEALDYLTKNAKELGVKAATYPETPDEKELSLTKDEEAAGRQAVTRTIHSAF